MRKTDGFRLVTPCLRKIWAAVLLRHTTFPSVDLQLEVVNGGVRLSRRDSLHQRLAEALASTPAAALLYPVQSPV